MDAAARVATRERERAITPYLTFERLRSLGRRVTSRLADSAHVPAILGHGMVLATARRYRSWRASGRQ